MKKVLLFLVAFILFLNVGVSVAQDDPKNMNVPEGKAIIYIVRVQDGQREWRSVNKIDGVNLPTMSVKNYVYRVVDPGDHKVVCKGSTKESIVDIKAESGKKYYVIQKVIVGVVGVYWTKLALENDMAKAAKTIKDFTEAKFKDAK